MSPPSSSKLIVNLGSSSQRFQGPSSSKRRLPPTCFTLPPLALQAAATERAVPPPPVIPSTLSKSNPNAFATMHMPGPSLDAAHHDIPSHLKVLTERMSIALSTHFTAAADN